jgi:hypothetical protein
MEANTMKSFPSLAASLAFGAAAFPALVAADEGYPTLERTAYVLQCMRDSGGQSMDNLYTCSCIVDKVMNKVSFDDYSEAQTFIQYKRMPGDKGGIFRDQPQADAVLAALTQAEAEAKQGCFVRRKEVKLSAEGHPAAD